LKGGEDFGREKEKKKGGGPNQLVKKKMKNPGLLKKKKSIWLKDRLQDGRGPAKVQKRRKHRGTAEEIQEKVIYEIAQWGKEAVHS